MKKPHLKFGLCFFALIFIFTACANPFSLTPKEPPGLQAPLEYDVSIEFADFFARARVTAKNYENFSFVFYEPESIKGFEIRLENSIFQYEMNGIKTDHKQDTLPSEHAAMLLFLSLQAILTNTYTSASFSDNVWTYEGIVSNSLFIFKQNNETFMPISLSFPQRQLDFNFFPQTDG